MHFCSWAGWGFSGVSVGSPFDRRPKLLDKSTGHCSEVVGVSANDGAPTGCLKWVRFCSYLRLLSGIDLIWISDYKWRSAGV